MSYINTVCIRCTAYNHEPYIRDCLDGFVMQQTDFPFVAIVHDDCSTDGTADIIREYAEKYPDIIKPIYESENQYSKHDGSLRKIMNEATAKIGAKYIAMCEGDDYWTDPHKLQRQVDFMEAHPEYTMCFHNVLIRYQDRYSKHSNFYNDSRQAPLKDLIMRGGDFVPTLSMLLRASTYWNMPKEVTSQYVGDYPLQMYMAIAGKVMAFNDVMGVYRVIPTSATATLLNNRQKIASNIEKELKIYRDFNRLTEGKFKGWFEKRKYFYLSNQMYKLDRYKDARKYWWKSRLCYSKNNRQMILDIHGRIALLRFMQHIVRDILKVKKND